MKITLDGSGWWAELDTAQFQVARVEPGILAADGDWSCYRMEAGQAQHCPPDQAEYVLGNEMYQGGQQPDFVALGREVVQRIHDGVDLLPPSGEDDGDWHP